MMIYKAKDYADMSRKAANILSAQIIMKPDCVLGLATGSTPIGLYKWFDKGVLDFSRVRTVNLDEYGMEPDSEKECDRYAGQIRSLGGIDLQLLGIGTIMRAKKILVVANGEGKAEIVRQAFFGPVTPYVPASILQLHNDVILVADEAALSRIP